MHVVFTQPVVNLYKDPQFGSEVVSQGIFNETAIVKRIQGFWTEVMTQDGYFGWTQNCNTQLDPDYETTHKVWALSACVFKKMEIKTGPLFQLSYGTRIKVIDEQEGWQTIELPDGTNVYIRKGDTCAPDKNRHPEDFDGIPYVWGGRSSFGFDCSGLVQMLCRERGIFLPRDVKDQIQDPHLTEVSEGEAHDLIFFGTTHVGYSLGYRMYIHASDNPLAPRVQISELTEKIPYKIFRYQKELT